jgi:hypothetical protein
MIEPDTSREFADLYEQLRYNVEILGGLIKTMDAIVQTILHFDETSLVFQAAHRDDDSRLTASREALAQVSRILAAVHLKVEHFRDASLPASGPVN